MLNRKGFLYIRLGNALKPVQMYSEDQKNKLDYLSRVALHDIERREEELSSHLRLNYSMLTSIEEKDDFTEKKFKEVIELLGKLEGSLADYINAAIGEDLYGFNNPIKMRIIENVIDGNILEEDLDLILLDIDFEDYENGEEDEYLGIDFALFGAKNSYPIIYEFIELMGNVDMFDTLKSFRKDAKMEIPEEDKFKVKVKNKSLLFEGKSMNLSERIKLANEILDFESIIRKLNLLESEKYQLMAYILGNDVNNVRNRVNGTRSDKVRELGLKKYLENLKK